MKNPIKARPGYVLVGFTTRFWHKGAKRYIYSTNGKPFPIYRVNINGVDFPQEGEYRIIIEVDGTFVCERRILALRPPQ